MALLTDSEKWGCCKRSFVLILSACDAHCLTCSDEGECETCDIGYRVEDGSCTGALLGTSRMWFHVGVRKHCTRSLCVDVAACPAFCDSCSVDDTTGDVLCGECEDGHGTKTHDTCDGKRMLALWFLSVQSSAVEVRANFVCSVHREELQDLHSECWWFHDV